MDVDDPRGGTIFVTDFLDRRDYSFETSLIL